MSAPTPVQPAPMQQSGSSLQAVSLDQKALQQVQLDIKSMTGVL